MLKIEDYGVILKSALEKSQAIVLGCNCEVKYSGRAESFLPDGDRIILIKEDKTLLIHQPTGNNPVNYMKAGSSHIFTIEGEKGILKSKNSKEFLEVSINRIHFFNYLKMSDGKSIVLTGTEKDMADMLMKNPSLIEGGFKPFSQEEHTKYGFIDVFGTDKFNNMAVVECKRYCADLSAVTQLRRYVEKIMDSKGIKNVRGILAAPRITPNAEKMLKDWGFSFVEVAPPKYLEKFDKNQQSLHTFTQ